MRNFSYLYISQLFSIVGDGFFRICLIFVSLNVGGTKLLSSIFAMQAVIIAVTVLFSGVLNNFLKPKQIVIYSTILRTLTCIYFLFLITMSNNLNLYYIIIGVLFGISDSLYRPNYMSILKYNVTEKKYDKEVGLLTSSRQLLNIITPIIATFIFDITNSTLLLILCILIFISSSLFSLGLVDYSTQKNTFNHRFLHEMFLDIKEGFIYIYKSNWLRAGMLISILVIPFQQALSNVVVPAFSKELSDKTMVYGSILTAYAIGATLSGILFGKIGRFFNKINRTFIVIFIAYFIYSFSGIVYTIFLASLISFLVGFMIQIYNISWEKFTIQQVEEKYIGNISSVSWFIFSSISPIMISIVGFLISIYNVRNIIIIVPIVICLMIISIYLITIVKKGKYYEKS